MLLTNSTVCMVVYSFKLMIVFMASFEVLKGTRVMKLCLGPLLTFTRIH